MFLISCLLFAIAALFNAAIEQIAHHNGGRFRFWLSNKPKWLQWFNADGNSWRIENEQIRLFRWWRILPVIPAILSDAWHFFKTISVTCLIASVATYRPCFGLFTDILILYMVRVAAMQFGYFYLFAPVRPILRFFHFFSSKIVIRMSKVKSLRVLETRYITPQKDGSFTVQSGILPTTVEIDPNAPATWTEDAQSDRSGIYAFQNILEFKVVAGSPTRAACRSHIAGIVTLEDGTTYFVANLRVAATLTERIGLTKIRTYRYRADQLSCAPQVNVVSASNSAGSVQIVISPRTTGSNNGLKGIIGVTLLGR